MTANLDEPLLHRIRDEIDSWYRTLIGADDPRAAQVRDVSPYPPVWLNGRRVIHDRNLGPRDYVIVPGPHDPECR
jgi:hypothetical protein